MKNESISTQFDNKFFAAANSNPEIKHLEFSQQNGFCLMCKNDRYKIVSTDSGGVSLNNQMLTKFAFWSAPEKTRPYQTEYKVENLDKIVEEIIDFILASPS